MQMTLQSFIDKLFESIFTADSSLPPAVKYLYDLFDSVAFQHGLTDPEVVHSWKSNRSVSVVRLIYNFHLSFYLVIRFFISGADSGYLATVWHPLLLGTLGDPN